VPVGLFLSGGIDSPVVAAKLRDAGRQDIPAFTIGSDEDRFDETQEAMAYAKELDLKHHVQVITPRDALDMLEGVTAACSEPFADYSIFPTMLVSRLASQHVKVVLSGDGGDELFWGYVPRFQAVLRRTRDFAQPRWLRQARWLFRRHIRVGNAIRGLCEEDIGAWYLSKHSILLVGRQNGIFPDLGLPEDFTLFDYRGYEPAETAQWLRWNEFTCHLPGVLLKVDRASMYHSLEVRVPLLDREVIAVAGRIDWESCLDLQNGMGKLPLRHVLSRAVSHQSQAKRGFSVPMANWLREDLRPIFEDCVCNRTELIGVPLQPGGIQRLWKQHLSGQANHERALWALLSLALWEARHLKPAQKVVHPHD
jgi:asparagine synthase (glutamine-hydrolysing)